MVGFVIDHSNNTSNKRVYIKTKNKTKGLFGN